MEKKEFLERDAVTRRDSSKLSKIVRKPLTTEPFFSKVREYT